MSLLPEITADRFESPEQLTPAVLQVADMLGMYGAELARVLGLQCGDVAQMRAARRFIDNESAAWQRAVLFGRLYQVLHQLMRGDEAAMCHWLRAENVALSGVPLLLLVDDGRLADVLDYLEKQVAVT